MYTVIIVVFWTLWNGGTSILNIIVVLFNIGSGDELYGLYKGFNICEVVDQI